MVMDTFVDLFKNITETMCVNNGEHCLFKRVVAKEQ